MYVVICVHACVVTHLHEVRVTSFNEYLCMYVCMYVCMYGMYVAMSC